ncbi:MAG: DeoR/GlpR transcriptional regulator [Erysipelotrichaceae bacterium]|nr:DeoR/GlpR transcriptional regulator [Erysipelotrichaceae bacterium]
MKYDRQKEMLEYIERKGSVRNEELLDKFNISIQTLRRDLDIFEKQGQISKVYGGVVYDKKQDSISSVGPVSKRNESFTEEKEYVGKLAASLVEDGDVIFIDSGSTVYRMLHYMKDLKNVTVISHCLDVMNELRYMPNLTGICVGGVIQQEYGTFIVDSSFYPYNYNKAFISTVGISTSKSLTNTNLYEGAMKRHVISQSNASYIVADHSKFDLVAYNHFADFSGIKAIITDQRPSEKYMNFFESRQIEIIY